MAGFTRWMVFSLYYSCKTAERQNAFLSHLTPVQRLRLLDDIEEYNDFKRALHAYIPGTPLGERDVL